MADYRKRGSVLASDGDPEVPPPLDAGQWDAGEPVTPPDEDEGEAPDGPAPEEHPRLPGISPPPVIEPGDEDVVTVRGTLPELVELAEALAVPVGSLQVTDVLRVVRVARHEAREARLALERMVGARGLERLQARQQAVVCTDTDAAQLIFSKCQPDVLEAFAIAREVAPPDYSDATVIAALLTNLCRQGEQHTGDYEAVDPRLTVRPVGAAQGHPVASAPPTPFGREARACRTCGTVFAPVKQGQVYGCNACGDYPNYVTMVERDRREYDPARALDPFDLYCLKKSVRCVCGQGTDAAAVIGPQATTRPRQVVMPGGTVVVVDEPVAAGT